MKVSRRRARGTSSTAADTPPGWEYFEHSSATLSLRRVSAQLAKDGGRPENAKYVAHQIALLYQCANAARGEGKALRRRIEERFEEVKGETEGGGALSEESRAWLAETAAEGEALTTPREAVGARRNCGRCCAR